MMIVEHEINLRDYWRVIVKWKKSIAVIVVVITLFSALISLFLPKIYKTDATIMVVGGQRSGGVAMAAAQMGLGGLLGGIGGGSSSSTQLLVILKSRTLAEKMIERSGLMKIFYEELWDKTSQKWKVDDPKDLPQMEDAVKNFFSQVTFSEDKKSQLLIITAQMEDPNLAAEVVNGYIKELADYINENTFTAAKRNRIFIEGQLERNKAELLESGKELTAFYGTNKISNVVPTVDVDVSMNEAESGEQTTAESLERKVENLTADAKGLPGIPAAFADVQKKTDELRKKTEAVAAMIKKAHVVKNIPQQVYLQYLTLRRELLGQVNALLTQQYEMAKIDEAKEDLNFQVIDWARVPGKRLKPKRRQIVMTAFAMSLFLAVFYAFFREYLAKIRLPS